MKNALILHGIGNSSQDNWFPWLKAELEKKGYQVFVPDLPNFNQPNLDNTIDFLKDFDFNDESILIGHSSGAAIILGILQKLQIKKMVKKVLLVGGFMDSDLKQELFKFVSKSDYSNHFPKNWDWEKIKCSAQKFIIIHSSSDPYVPMNQGQFIAEKLKGKLVNIPEGKHFSIYSVGEEYRQFQELLNYI